MLTPLSQDLGRYMDLLAERQRLVAANLANIDTPGYRTRDIDFQFEFLSLAPGARPHVIEPSDLTVKNDGNNVSLDRETRLLAENALRFNVASQLARVEIRKLRMAIEEGRTA
ncbi:MAG: flagellar basal body rod protein FlgB [Bryobacteraceae bacterium]|nr:MAG: flagellar basal body rod protein FlgB [Bryobacteraceae bacterium]